MINNTAGALTPVVDWLNNEIGSEATIIQQSHNDIFALTSCSPYAIMTEGREIYSATIREIIERQPSVIHINSTIGFIPLVRLFAPRTPLVYMYHGSEIRERLKAGLGEMLDISLADKVIVSTQDLRRFGEWFDRPIPSHFVYRGGRKKGTALMMYAEFFGDYDRDKRDLARLVCEELGLDLTIRESRNAQPIPNMEMPLLYSQYEYYLDFKGFDTRDTFAVSKSGLEAMLCGCKVLHDSSPLTVLDPREHLSGRSLYEKYRLMYQGLKPASYPTGIKRCIEAVVRIIMTARIGGYLAKTNRPTVFGLMRLGLYSLLFLKTLARKIMRKVSE